jgi:hypothetical protein
MTSSLKEVVDEVEAQLDDATVSFARGRKALKEYAELRRCVWVPVGGPLDTHTHQVGGRVHPTSGNREEAVLTRRLTCEVHVWDGTSEVEETRLDASETLMHQLLAVIRDRFMGSVRFGAEEWRTQTDEGADYAVAGEKVVFTCSFDIPVIRESKALTVIAAQSTLVTFGWSAFDDGFDEGFLIEI